MFNEQRFGNKIVIHLQILTIKQLALFLYLFYCLLRLISVESLLSIDKNRH